MTGGLRVQGLAIYPSISPEGSPAVISGGRFGRLLAEPVVEVYAHPLLFARVLGAFWRRGLCLFFYHFWYFAISDEILFYVLNSGPKPTAATRFFLSFKRSFSRNEL